MKLRILDNTLRFRLSRSDVRRLSERGNVAGKTQFPLGERFSFVLQRAEPPTEPSATYANGAIHVTLPAETLAHWAGSDEVGIEREFAVPNDAALRVLVEKDFMCLTPRADDDEADLYPHPDAGRRSC